MRHTLNLDCKTHHEGKDGKFPILIRVSLNGEHDYINTGRRIKVEHYDKKLKAVKKGITGYSSYTSHIDKQKGILEEIINDFDRKEEIATFSKIKEIYNSKTGKEKSISFHKFNESKKLEYVLDLLMAGKDLALVSDAGTPLILDPGCDLVLNARNKGIKIVAIPGPSSLTCALSLCSYKTNDFLFLGFLPERKSIREKTIRSFRERASLVILFVAPHDLKKYSGEIFGVYPDIDVFYARELTKVFEECWYGKLSELIEIVNNRNLKGEIVLGLRFGIDKGGLSLPENVDLDLVIKEMKGLINEGYSLKEASKSFADKLGLSKKLLYDKYLKSK